MWQTMIALNLAKSFLKATTVHTIRDTTANTYNAHVKDAPCEAPPPTTMVNKPPPPRVNVIPNPVRYPSLPSVSLANTPATTY